MCRWIFLWIWLTSLVVAVPEEQQYCAVRYRRLCQGKGRHIACQFPDSGPGPSCERYTPINFTEDLKHFVTHYLNRRRQRIAAGNERVRGGVHLPKPQVMMLVEWDRELSLLAQRLADQCHFVHDDCRATVRYPYAGQTVGEVRWRRSSESDELSAQRAIRRVLDAWWGERRRVQPKQLIAPFRLTAKGTVWGHFSQLAVWNLQAVGCGAVRHGTEHPRLLLVCDFSHTNMLGQRTLVSGALATCPIHTVRRPRTSYPLLCAPVRRPLPTEPEAESEDNYEDYNDAEQEDTDLPTDMGDLSPRLGGWNSAKRKNGNTKIKTKPTTVEELSEINRKVHTKMHRGFQSTSATLKESINQKFDREVEQKIENDQQNQPVNHKMAHNRHENSQIDEPISTQNEGRNQPVIHKKIHKPFDPNQFDERLHAGYEWRAKKKQNLGHWRQREKSQGQENSEEVIPLSIPSSEGKETFEPRLADIHRPGSALRIDMPRNVEERERGRGVNRPSLVLEDEEKNLESDEGTFRPRWRQTRIRPQRPGANALLSYPSTEHSIKHYKKEQNNIQASLNLDREDIDQLFRDTGFDVNWRKHTT